MICDTCRNKNNCKRIISLCDTEYFCENFDLDSIYFSNLKVNDTIYYTQKIYNTKVAYIYECVVIDTNIFYFTIEGFGIKRRIERDDFLIWSTSLEKAIEEIRYSNKIEEYKIVNFDGELL